jgi:adenine/guanine phosphoribosyltransferase-like PRPP-binding protein
VSSFNSDAKIKVHARYADAKAGNAAAAARLVIDLVTDTLVEAAGRRFGPDVVYVPVLAEEASGRNKIPQALARRYADGTGASVVLDIVQSTRAHHTGARPLTRLISRPLFDGPVAPDCRHVLVDDVSVLGSTLAELSNHIQAHAGAVAGIVLLVNAARRGHFAPRPQHIRLIDERFGDCVRTEFGIEPVALTGPEASYLANFRDAEQLRDAIAKVRRARGGRGDPC